MTENSEFLTSMDKTFRMKSAEWLMEAKEKDNLSILDLRAKEAFERNNIKGSINILLKDLPHRFKELDSSKPLIALCNGSVQSAYAIMFLYSVGFKEVFNLSGGFSNWEKFQEDFNNKK